MTFFYEDTFRLKREPVVEAFSYLAYWVAVLLGVRWWLACYASQPA